MHGIETQSSGKTLNYFEIDGHPLNEKNPKWLYDDYVKFIRYSEWQIGLTGLGVLGFITNHSYIDNPTFRGMRQSLLSDFHKIWLLDLHGSIKKRGKALKSKADENVFDIQQGVAIIIATSTMLKECRILKSDIIGLRKDKYGFLSQGSINTTEWQQVYPASPFYLFLPEDKDLRNEFLKFPSIKRIMPVNVLGFQTHRDHFAIAFERETILSRFSLLRDSKLSDIEIKEHFGLSDNRDWSVHTARRYLRGDNNWKDRIIQCLYRPFDTRWCYFGIAAMDYPRRELINHVAGKENICLLVPRQISSSTWQHASLSRTVAESCLISNKTKEGNYNFPLYLYLQKDLLSSLSSNRVNISNEFLFELAKVINQPLEPITGLPKGLTPEDIFQYIYAVLYSPNYRNRYNEFLKIDFPRIPLTSSLELFRVLSRLGGELVSLHLMESPRLNTSITIFQGSAPSNKVEKITYSDQNVWVDKGQTEGFQGIPKNVWDSYIGSYQICDKWLKDRRGRVLSEEDITHYQKIFVALNETIRLTGEIDQVIEEHGGWPGAFVSEAKD